MKTNSNSSKSKVKFFPIQLKGIFNKYKNIENIENFDEEFSKIALDFSRTNEHGENILFEVSIYDFRQLFLFPII